MSFIISKDEIENGLSLIVASDEYSGVKKIAKLVAGDISLVVGSLPAIKEANSFNCGENNIFAMTLGHSELVNTLHDEAGIDINVIKDKRESYIFKIIDGSLYIIGSDKRGTIYGLFHLSELMGVSPLVNWTCVKPRTLDKFIIKDTDSFISKEPSVKYRGFFINDEWPAFGNWCNKRFGGFNAKCYEKVFELLLRLKGNYLWPAMWAAIFSNDGPGMDSAVLADELGVVMGMSHHEPCLRNGEEYKYLRGKDSIYGDAWNFRTNEKGITKFWEDGLKRNGHLENVITVGMRGEADSTIMGEDATLKDNIDLLRDVLKCQNQLIRENVNENLDDVPRMLALYKEVEPFFYGDDNTPGLIGSEELEGVTLMLCDDNFGNLRTVPTEQMRTHKGGYGMYYHFDYHGWPISYEWVNSSYLPKVWEQMTDAYEFGIRDLWIVNVGDIFTTEYPLAYFLDLAYDYDKWGISNINSPREYTKKFVEYNLGQYIDRDDLSTVEDMFMTYTKVGASRRPEAMNENVYPVFNGQALEHLNFCKEQMDLCENIYSKVRAEGKNAFFELLYYPMMANLNIHYLWCATGINHGLSLMGSTYSEHYAQLVKNSLQFDKELVEKLHLLDNGRWYGMGLSEHIGFRNWNEEECHKPVIYQTLPENKKRIIVQIPGTKDYTEGGDWTKKTLVLKLGKNEKRNIRLLSVSDMDASFNIDSNDTYVNIKEGIVKANGMLEILVGLAEGKDKGSIIVNTEAGGHIKVDIVSSYDTFDRFGQVIIEAADYNKLTACDDYSFVKIPEYGLFDSAIKVMPVTGSFSEENGPSVTYDFDADEAGQYEINVLISPSNPAFNDGLLRFGFNINGDDSVIDTVPTGFKIGDNSPFWHIGVLDNIRTIKKVVSLSEGINHLTIRAISPRLVIQRIVINKV